MEKWATIKECKRYAISNYGRVKNTKTNKIIKPSLNQKGYQIVCLMKDKKKTMFNVARLVGIYFVSKRKGAKEINHKNLNRHDNRQLNIEWLTHKENIVYSQGIKTTLTNTKWKRQRHFKTLLETAKFLKTTPYKIKKYAKEQKAFNGYLIELEKGGNIYSKI